MAKENESCGPEWMKTTAPTREQKSNQRVWHQSVDGHVQAGTQQKEPNRYCLAFQNCNAKLCIKRWIQPQNTVMAWWAKSVLSNAVNTKSLNFFWEVKKKEEEYVGSWEKTMPRGLKYSYSLCCKNLFFFPPLCSKHRLVLSRGSHHLKGWLRYRKQNHMQGWNTGRPQRETLNSPRNGDGQRGAHTSFPICNEITISAFQTSTWLLYVKFTNTM